MFETIELQSLSHSELLAEYVRATEYIDKLIALGNTLNTCYSSSLALASIYATQKGHEVFLMALDVVEQSSEKRLREVAKRTTTLMLYVTQIEELYGTELPYHEEWPAYEVLIEAFEG